jgi:hypothetical protein
MFFVSVLQRQRRLSEPAQAASAAPLRSGRITSRVWTLPRTQMLFASYERGLPETLSPQSNAFAASAPCCQNIPATNRLPANARERGPRYFVRTVASLPIPERHNNCRAARIRGRARNPPWPTCSREVLPTLCQPASQEQRLKDYERAQHHIPTLRSASDYSTWEYSQVSQALCPKAQQEGLFHKPLPLLWWQPLPQDQVEQQLRASCWVMTLR